MFAPDFAKRIGRSVPFSFFIFSDEVRRWTLGRGHVQHLARFGFELSWDHRAVK